MLSSVGDRRDRRVRDAELPAYVDALSTGFLERPDVAKVAEELRPLWDLSRTWVAFDGTRGPAARSVPGRANSRCPAELLAGGGRLRGDRAADPSAAGDHALDGRGRTRGRARARRGLRAALRRRIPDLRPVWLWARLSGGDMDARRPRHVPDAVGRHRRDRHARRARSRCHEGGVRRHPEAVARRGAAASVPVGLRHREAERLGRGLEGLPGAATR